jgi:hypothetical protein
MTLQIYQIGRIGQIEPRFKGKLEEFLRKIDQVHLFHPVDHILQVARNLPFNYNE